MGLLYIDPDPVQDQTGSTMIYTYYIFPIPIVYLSTVRFPRALL